MDASGSGPLPAWTFSGVGSRWRGTVSASSSRLPGNYLGAPTVNVVLAGLVIAGGIWALTVSVKLCAADVPTRCSRDRDRIAAGGPAAGVPLSVAVLFPLLTNVSTVGKRAGLTTVGVGVPVTVTMKVPAVPVVNVVTGRARDRWRLVDRQGEALGGRRPTPLLAVIVSG
jgi:hypothetical protein